MVLRSLLRRQPRLATVADGLAGTIEVEVGVVESVIQFGYQQLHVLGLLHRPDDIMVDDLTRLFHVLYRPFAVADRTAETVLIQGVCPLRISPYGLLLVDHLQTEAKAFARQFQIVVQILVQILHGLIGIDLPSEGILRIGSVVQRCTLTGHHALLLFAAAFLLRTESVGNLPVARQRAAYLTHQLDGGREVLLMVGGVLLVVGLTQFLHPLVFLQRIGVADLQAGVEVVDFLDSPVLLLKAVDKTVFRYGLELLVQHP